MQLAGHQSSIISSLSLQPQAWLLHSSDHLPLIATGLMGPKPPAHSHSTPAAPAGSRIQHALVSTAPRQQHSSATTSLCLSLLRVLLLAAWRQATLDFVFHSSSKARASKPITYAPATAFTGAGCACAASAAHRTSFCMQAASSRRCCMPDPSPNSLAALLDQCTALNIFQCPQAAPCFTCCCLHLWQ